MMNLVNGLGLMMESEISIEEVLQTNDIEVSAVSTISQEDFYNFNNNVVVMASFVSISLGIVGGLVLGHIFNGIFTD